jgi:hypothetical protein
MATEQEMDALIERLNAATNKLAATLKDLRDQLAAGGLTQEQEAAAVAKLDSAIASLEAMGADPQQPIPEA